MKYSQNIHVYGESILLFYISQFRYNDEPLKISGRLMEQSKFLIYVFEKKEIRRSTDLI